MNNMSLGRLRAQKVKSTGLGAPLKVTVIVEKYEYFEGTTREGEHYDELRVFFTEKNIPKYIHLNQTSLQTLATKGFGVTDAELAKELPGCKLFFELQKPKGSYNYYKLMKVIGVKKK